MSGVQQLNDRLGIPGVAEVIMDRGGLPAVWIEGGPACQGATGTIYLHGAHLAAWHPPDTDEVLWLSEKSAWQSGKAIRGGVPICFPWFGPRQNQSQSAAGSSTPIPVSPAHGFARIKEWQLESIRQTPEGIRVSFALSDDEASRALWPHEFLLRNHITVGHQLIMSLELTNTGNAPFQAEEAQHTYFSVGDVRQVRVAGVDGGRYIDKVDELKEKSQQGEVTITGETDRIYLNTTGTLTMEDPAKRRRISLHKQNSQDSVIWNPWVAKAKAMADFGDEEWRSMICLETCNVGQPALTLEPGQTHIMGSRISVEPL